MTFFVYIVYIRYKLEKKSRLIYDEDDIYNQIGLIDVEDVFQLRYLYDIFQ